MKRLEGIHFYINIKNFNEIVTDDETKTGAVTHSIHALDTFFSSIERYGKCLYSETLTVEKITGSRLHIYIVDDIIPANDAVRTVSVYAFELSKYINKELVINPVTAPYVQLIFRWFLAGHTTGEIVKRLTLLGMTRLMINTPR